jgi:hypothetical protein
MTSKTRSSRQSRSEAAASKRKPIGKAAKLQIEEEQLKENEDETSYHTNWLAEENNCRAQDGLIEVELWVVPKPLSLWESLLQYN